MLSLPAPEIRPVLYLVCAQLSMGVDVKEYTACFVFLGEHAWGTLYGKLAGMSTFEILTAQILWPPHHMSCSELNSS